MRRFCCAPSPVSRDRITRRWGTFPGSRKIDGFASSPADRPTSPPPSPTDPIRTACHVFGTDPAAAVAAGALRLGPAPLCRHCSAVAHSRFGRPAATTTCLLEQRHFTSRRQEHRQSVAGSSAARPSSHRAKGGRAADARHEGPELGQAAMRTLQGCAAKGRQAAQGLHVHHLPGEPATQAAARIGWMATANGHGREPCKIRRTSRSDEPWCQGGCQY